MSEFVVGEEKKASSRRTFLKRLALFGILPIATGAGLFFLLKENFLLNSKTTTTTDPIQQIVDPTTNQILKTSDIPENGSRNFVYPRTGNTTYDSNTFAQCVVIHLPKGFTTPKGLGVTDPISGDSFIAFSRVCVHLWCLCSYDATNELIECPCHGSNYVPGFGPPYDDWPGTAVSGPASEQAAPNNTLPVIVLSVATDGTLSATGIVGEIGCGQKCGTPSTSSSTTPTFPSE